MKVKNRKFLSVAAVALLSVGMLSISGPASATTEYVGGGEWRYGHSGSITYSHYYHPTKLHRSTSCTPSGCTRSPDRSGGLWAYAYRGKAVIGNDAYWYVY